MSETLALARIQDTPSHGLFLDVTCIVSCCNCTALSLVSYDILFRSLSPHSGLLGLALGTNLVRADEWNRV